MPAPRHLHDRGADYAKHAHDFWFPKKANLRLNVSRGSGEHRQKDECVAGRHCQTPQVVCPGFRQRAANGRKVSSGNDDRAKIADGIVQGNVTWSRERLLPAFDFVTANPSIDGCQIRTAIATAKRHFVKQGNAGMVLRSIWRAGRCV